MELQKNFREILTKEPFYRLLPDGYLKTIVVTGNKFVNEPKERLKKLVVTQADFLREYYPTSHAINDPERFPDVVKQDPDTGKFYIQPVTRCSFAFQQVIATKQIVHLVGNDVQFELAEEDDNERFNEQKIKKLNTFKTGWLTKNMEIRFYEAVKSLKVTGDAAIVGFFHNGEFFAKTFSFLNGDKLYPHFDAITGELELFARKYYDYDEDGVAVTEWVEIWDEKYFYRAKRDAASDSFTHRIKTIFGFNDFAVIEKRIHGFSRVPVAYVRNNGGPCWAPSQDVIEKYEESFSYLAESNKAFGFPIFYAKGDEIDIQGDMNGSVKAISLPSDGEAGFLNRQDVSNAFNTQLIKLYDLIYELSFSVKPPELKSGDLPGVALKLLYSPAIEKAIHDAQELQPFLDTLVGIFKEGYGFEINEQTSLMQLKINTWIQPYIHQNDTELTTNLAMAVQNDFLSRRTASERLSVYSKPGEMDRIIREKKEEQQQDLLNEIVLTETKTDENIREQKEIIAMNEGQDVNTGRGHGAGRPNKYNTDENGNRPGENNWDEWNRLH